MQLRLPATSANLGPAFDAAALALDRWLIVDATESDDAAAKGSILATGLNPEICGAAQGNLILDTYSETLLRLGREVRPLAVKVDNQIPLGMGLGSSAAARLAGVALAAHFGKLGWSGQEILEEACRLEKHPDNAAACWLRGFVTAVTHDGKVIAAKFVPPVQWTPVVVLPRDPVPTERARAVLPEQVSRQDAVANLQRSALLTAAFAQSRGDWLQEAMRDALHQPHRASLCPLLPRLLPMAGTQGVMGVALSGAGPAVLLLVESPEAASAPELHARIHALAGEQVALLVCRLVGE